MTPNCRRLKRSETGSDRSRRHCESHGGRLRGVHQSTLSEQTLAVECAARRPRQSKAENNSRFLWPRAVSSDRPIRFLERGPSRPRGLIKSLKVGGSLYLAQPPSPSGVPALPAHSCGCRSLDIGWTTLESASKDAVPASGGRHSCADRQPHFPCDRDHGLSRQRRRA